MLYLDKREVAAAMDEQKPSFIAQEKDNIIIVRMYGPLNSSTLNESRDQINELIEKHEIFKRSNLRILVDYENVTDVDSATIANILERIKEHEKHNHVIAFINVPEEFKHIVEIHKLENKVHIFKSEKQAIKELSKPSQ